MVKTPCSMLVYTFPENMEKLRYNTLYITYHRMKWRSIPIICSKLSPKNRWFFGDFCLGRHLLLFYYNNFCKNGKRAARCTADNFYTKSARQKPAASVQDTGSRTYSARTGVAGFGRNSAGKAAAYWKSTARCTAIKHEKAHRPFHERRACGCYSPKSCFFFASKSCCVIRPSSSSALKRRRNCCNSLTAQMQPIFFACQLCRAQKAKDQKSCPSSWRNRRCCARPLLRYGSVSEVSL